MPPASDINDWNEKLFSAIDALDVAGVEAALRFHADPNAPRPYPTMPLVCPSPLLELTLQKPTPSQEAMEQRYAIARALIEAGAFVDYQEHSKATPLHWAAFYDDMPMMKRLLAAGARLNLPNRWGQTPEQLAEPEAAEYLRAIANGAPRPTPEEMGLSLPSGQVIHAKPLTQAIPHTEAITIA